MQETQAIQPVNSAVEKINPFELLIADKRSEATRRAYRADLEAFFCGNPSVEEVGRFVAQPAAKIALELAVYKNSLLQKGLAEATINRRLAAIRSLLKLAHRLGYASTDGRNLVDSEKIIAYRDTRGVDLETLRQLLQTPGTGDLRGLRDTAILRLFCENALRRAEVYGLNVGDFSASQRTLMIAGKGRGTQRQPVTLSERGVEAIVGYLLRAGHATDQSGPLFRNLDHRPQHLRQRLTSDGLFYLVKSYGEAIGVKNLTPHKLRHSAITAALDATGGDVRKVQRLSRHADLRTLSIYDDNRSDFQGEVTGVLSDLL
ncbi:MAG: tyrosine-type recombinase/integrase [Abitibacteriaceae bacterium]|nr:tyrosine-type recombinase/integrase [Abditibacteriaceae bacterium]MBV9868275.1 tyrosine-type recombinase/integrase [Abditibacteriaceae bacterium]